LSAVRVIEPVVLGFCSCVVGSQPTKAATAQNSARNLVNFIVVIDVLS
jgi:hypothetical protein